MKWGLLPLLILVLSIVFGVDQRQGVLEGAAVILTCAWGKLLMPSNAKRVPMLMLVAQQIATVSAATCDSYTCLSGLYQPNPSTITCMGACDELTCCFLTCGGHSCSSGTLKANPSTVVCVSSCTDPECCDQVTCDSHSCSVGVLKTSPSSITCASTTCVDTECCDISHCDTHGCSAGSLKSNPSLITCSGSACTDTECCDIFHCDTHGCSVGSLKSNPSLITCLGSVCTDTECCEGVCSFHTCGMGSLKPAASTIACSGACDDIQCCQVTCENHNCPSSTSLRNGYLGITCPLGGCADVDCCNQLCGSHSCGVGTPMASSTICPGDCTDGDCCELHCDSHTCTSGSLKTNPGTIICSRASCDDTTCCESTFCDTHTCGDSRILYSGSSTIECPLGVCTDTVCCQPQKCHSFNCPSGIFRVPSSTDCPTGVCTEVFCCTIVCQQYTCTAGVLKTTAAFIDCQGTCDDSKCCDTVMCDTHTCPSDYVQKGAAGSTECPFGACSDTLCCDPLCSSYTCQSGGLVAASNTITCLNNVCDDVTCCEQKYCDSHTCSSGIVKMGVECPLAICSDAVCCDPVCGSGYSCPTATILKPNPDTVLCPGSGTCTDAVCCDPVCGVGFVCSSDTVLKSSPNSILCPGSGCDVSTCCDTSCSQYSCTGNTLLKLTAATIPCDSMTGCTPSQCCDEVCSSHSCRLGGLKSSASTIRCLSQGCDDPTCCEQRFCDSFSSCPSGYSSIANPSGTECPQAICTSQTCCIATCESHTCSTGIQKVNPGSISCLSSGCTDLICCDPLYCDSHQCGSGYALKQSPGMIECLMGGCTDSLCCLETCDRYTCLMGVSKGMPSGIMCSVSGCDEGTCCETTYCSEVSVCSSTGAMKQNSNQIECLSLPGGCSADNCCNPSCDGFSCPSGTFLKTLPSDIFCPAGTCADHICCDPLPRCDSFTCPPNTGARPTPSAITCDPLVGCLSSTCCFPSCSSFQCSTGVLKTSPGLIICDGGGGVCTDGVCCVDKYCDSYTCVTGYMKGSPHTILCDKGVCVNSVCCDAPKDTNSPLSDSPVTVAPTAIPVVTAVPKVVPPTTSVPSPSPTSAAPQSTAVPPIPPTAPPTTVPSSPPTPLPTTVTDTPSISPITGTPAGTQLPVTIGAASSTNTPIITTISPSTKSPPSEVSEVSDRIESASYPAATAVAAGAVFTGAAAGQASQLAFVADINCLTREEWENETLPFLLHPTQLTIAGSSFTGVIVGNLLIVTAFIIACFVLMRLLNYAPSIRTLDTSGLIRFPSLPLFVFLFLYQGTTYAALRLMAYPTIKRIDILGACVLLLCLAVPAKLCDAIRRDVPKTARYRLDESNKHSVFVFFLGPGEWVSASPALNWVKRYKTVISSYRESTAAFVCAQFAVALLLSIAKVRFAESMIECGHVRMACAVIFLMAFLLDLWRRPYCKPSHIYLASGINLCQVAGLAAIAKGFYSEDLTDPAFDVGGVFVMIALILLVIKAILDLLTFVYVVATGRRDRLQELEWKNRAVLIEELNGRKGTEGEELMTQCCYTSLSSDGESGSKRRVRKLIIEIDNDSFGSVQQPGGRRRSTGHLPYPYTLSVNVESRNHDVSGFSSNYSFDGIRGGYPSWSSGSHVLKQVRGRWELREGSGEFFRICCDERHPNRLPHEACGSWMDQNGFPCEVSITAIDASQQLQLPSTHSTPVTRPRWVPDEWNVPLSPTEASGRGSHLTFDSHRGETPTLGIPRYIRFVGSATPGGMHTPLSGVAI
eukprot:TRINITY_DN2845_c6_g1_i1.p1 TRINITY_DN2845_c6_g1~~TRINITY_DN2845_c6_g1_i1.p1  ORF type:complete len:1759 (+),score=255.37 TRINITY_DN2845_c6_g1_i1:51-5327(+)